MQPKYFSKDTPRHFLYRRICKIFSSVVLPGEIFAFDLYFIVGSDSNQSVRCPQQLE